MEPKCYRACPEEDLRHSRGVHIRIHLGYFSRLKDLKVCDREGAITRRKNAFLMMNRYPYTVGHLMAVPYRKVAELSALGENEVVELWNLVVHAQALLRAAVKAQGFNIGLNLGECAGAGVPDHLHIHVVPRWTGDTNFMPIIGSARVLSDGLRALYDKLVEAQANMAASD